MADKKREVPQIEEETPVAATEAYQGDKTSTHGDKNIEGQHGNDGAANRTDEEEQPTKL